MKKTVKTRSDYSAAVRRLKALAHPARLRIMGRLSEGECCASEATKCIGISQPNTSQHLKALKDAGLITGRRQGTRICYRIADERIAEIVKILMKGKT
jgi:DNA-binding transcriptional ArsR family regulator